MKQIGEAYEPPKMKIYQFDDNDLVLTDSGTSTPAVKADYAADALNQLFGGTNTTIEK